MEFWPGFGPVDLIRDQDRVVTPWLSLSGPVNVKIRMASEAANKALLGHYSGLRSKP